MPSAVSDMVFRALRPQEFEEALTLCRDSILHAEHYNEAQRAAWAGFDRANWLSRLGQQHSGGAFHAHGHLIGLVSWQSRDEAVAWLDLVYVTPPLQRKGVGSALLDAAEQEAQRHGHVQVQTQASLQLQPLLLKRGYTLTEMRCPVVKQQSLSCALMQKVLS